jgi:DNA polymerase (family X)
VENRQIARTLEEIAALSEIAGENPHKIRAYRKAAATLGTATEDVAALSRAGKVTTLAGVGKGIGAVLDEIVATGGSSELVELQARVPASLLDVAKIGGLGPGRVRTLFDTLAIATVGEVIQACRENRLVGLAGFGKKLQEKVLESALFVAAGSGRFVLGKSRGVGASVVAALARQGIEARVAGETARGVEVNQGVLLVSAPGDLASTLAELAEGGVVRQEDDAYELVVGKMPVRVVVASPETFAARWVRATADEAHVAFLDGLAGGDFVLACLGAVDERAVYERLGTAFVPAELREGAAPEVPADLVNETDLLGCFHVHTDWSDGAGSLREMVAAAQKAGFSWIGLSDHSEAAGYANGLTRERLVEQRAAIDALRGSFPKIEILHGIEADILADGALDLDPEALARLDFVVASVHSQLRMERAAMTARLVKAVSNPVVTLLGHPRGRLLLARKGADFELSVVAEAARAAGTAFEINASPERMDLSAEDVVAASAGRSDLRFAINPDAHSPAALENVPLGLAVARRARLTREQVLTAGTAAEVRARLATRRATSSM